PHPTGDLGTIDAGVITIQGRRDNMFICAGENIQPEEIERLLLTHPAVTQAIVVPLADAEYGARPVAFIATGDQPIPADLIDHLRPHLPGIKLPTHFLLLPPESPERLKPSRAALTRLAHEQLAR